MANTAKANGFRSNRHDGYLELWKNGTRMGYWDGSTFYSEKPISCSSSIDCTVLQSSGLLGGANVVSSGLFYGGSGTKAQLASNGEVTYSAANMLTGYIEDTSVTGAVTATTDTAAHIIAAMAAASAGNYFDLLIHNDGNQTITVAGGDSVTLFGAAHTIAAGKAAIYRVYATSATAVAMFRIHDAA